MPTITCPSCNFYVQVPNLDRSGFFSCPTCPRTAARKLLYKCTSCMKVTILQAGARVCAKCSTMLRPAVRDLLLARSTFVPSAPTDWTYHTSNVRIVPSIQRYGLKSSFLRTGTDIAHPEGAFARNRDQRLAEPVIDKKSVHPVFQKLKEGLAYLACLGIATAYPGLVTVVPPDIAFLPTGGDTDGPELRKASDIALAALASMLGVKKLPETIVKAPNYFKVWRDEKTSALAIELITRPTHCLTIWARRYVSLYYRIEEMKTTHNIYFLKQSCAAEGYTEYTKGVSKEMIAVLRVRRAHVMGLVQDISEAKAECTPSIVLPRIIEIFVAPDPDSFVNPADRDNAANWINIEHWEA